MGDRGRAGGGRIRIGDGARAVEAALLAAVAESDAAARRDPSLLARPARVVVPSSGLRVHLGAALVRHFRRGVAGVSIQTLHGLALEILERAGERAPAGAALLPVLVRRHARAEPALRRSLDALVDAYGVVEANVSDLLDAGFERSQREAVEDRLVACGEQGLAVEHVQAVVDVTVRVLEGCDARGLAHRSALLERARAALEREPDVALPARAVWIHGFADATGVAAELIATLLRTHAAVVFLDEPPEPGAPQRSDPGVDFARGFRDQLGGVAAFARVGGPPSVPDSLVGLEAAGAASEVRAVAQRVRSLLDDGADAEGIGVVARDLAAYAIPLRIHFRRLGIPV